MRRRAADDGPEHDERVEAPRGERAAREARQLHGAGAAEELDARRVGARAAQGVPRAVDELVDDEVVEA